MDGGEAPLKWPRPRHARYELEHDDGKHETDREVCQHGLELARRPGSRFSSKNVSYAFRPAPAGGLHEEEQSIHALMISGASTLVSPFDLFNVPFGEPRSISRILTAFFKRT